MTQNQRRPHALGEEIWEYEQPLPRGIVSAVDESPESIEAFRMASEISVRRGWRLHVISVIPASAARNPGIELTGELPPDDVSRLERRTAVIKDLVAGNRNGADATYEVTLGDVTHSIVSAAECRGADLIVSGRTRHNSFDRLLGNETTLNLMRASRIPVLAVCEASEGLKHVVAATDFSDSSVRAARVASGLMGGTGTIHLVHVDEPRDIIAGVAVGHERHSATDIVAWFRRMSYSLIGTSGLRVEPAVLSGDPAATLLEFAERIGASLVAVGSHGYSRVERLFLGSVSTQLVRRSALPVLVARDDN